MAQLLDLGKLRFNFTGVYNPATQYEFNDVVKYGGSAYVYNNSTATAGNLPTNTSFWASMVDGIQFENDYNPVTPYQLNDVVIYGPQTYIAIADTVGNPPTDTDYWKAFTEGVGSTGNWSTATDYYPGDLVTRGGSQYRCIVAHTSSAEFSTDLGSVKWEVFVKGVRSRGSWLNLTTYLTDDIVSDGVNSYVALQDHTSGSGLFAEETGGLWELFVAGSSSLPPQLGEQNKLLSTDGFAPIWIEDVSLGEARFEATDTFFVGFNTETVVGSGGQNLTNVMAAFSTDSADLVSEHAQLVVTNSNTNDTSRTDVSVYPNDGTEAEGWTRVGVAGSAHTGINALIEGHDSYLISKAPTGTAGRGDLVIATGDTGTQNRIVLAAQGVDTEASQVEVLANQVKITPTTISSSPLSGALVVGGGVGIAGNLNVAGNQSVVGNVTIQGSISVSGGQFVTQSLSSSDPLLFVGSGNPANNFDLGFMTEAKFAATTYVAKFGSKSITDDVATLNVAEYNVSNRVLNSNVATLTIGTHQLEIGDKITVSGVNATFDGEHVIENADETTISYAKEASNSSSSPSTGTVSFRITFGDREDLIAGDILDIVDAGSPFDGTKVVKTVTSTAITFDLVNADVPLSVISPAATGTRTSRSKYSGVAKDNTTGLWHLFSGLAAKPTTTINFDLDEIQYDSIKLRNITATGGINSVENATERDSVFDSPTSGTIVYRQDTKIQEIYTGTKWDALDQIHPFLLMGV
jgi:hypothetical protein